MVFVKSPLFNGTVKPGM